MKNRLIASVLGLLALIPGAHAAKVTVTIENLSPNDPQGLYFTPVWTGFHDGSLDLFEIGSAPSAALETIAEAGDPGPLDALFMNALPEGTSVIQNSPGGPGPGVFAPGASASFTIELDGENHRYMSFATMVIPSNDTFIANDSPVALQLFDEAGNFIGTQSWTVLGSAVYDAGSEVNDPADGPAFVMGQDGSLGSAEGGVVSIQPVDGLDDFVGVTTPPGTMIGSGLENAPLFRITVAKSNMPVPVQVTIMNLASTDPLGLYFTPVWTAFHDGSFDVFDKDSPASMELETIAELGNPDGLDALFMSQSPSGLSVVQNDPMGPGPGVFAPGGYGSYSVTLDPSQHRYMSYATMVIPSNDTFMANEDPTAIELFDASGAFLGPRSLIVNGDQTWDAGTEVNNPAEGPAFVMGQDGTAGTSENGVISQSPVSALDAFIGATTPPGTLISEALSSAPFLYVSITRARWGNYPLANAEGDVFTGNFLGWINVAERPWIWSYQLLNWIYMPEESISSNGAWGYIPKP